MVDLEAHGCLSPTSQRRFASAKGAQEMSHLLPRTPPLLSVALLCHLLRTPPQHETNLTCHGRRLRAGCRAPPRGARRRGHRHPGCRPLPATPGHCSLFLLPPPDLRGGGNCEAEKMNDDAEAREAGRHGGRVGMEEGEARRQSRRGALFLLPPLDLRAGVTSMRRRRGGGATQRGRRGGGGSVEAGERQRGGGQEDER
uniref:Uncharacterized protein n=1 Tax=Arundo donax TaxID=35708 RepID=A0A0A8ZEN7_ARUDO